MRLYVVVYKLVNGVDMSENKSGYSYFINGKQAQTINLTPSSSRLLSDAGFEPADDYVLIQRTQHGSKVVSSDEVLALGEGEDEFFAFQGGAIFELTVNEHSIFWGDRSISAGQIRHLANVPAEDELIWVRDEATNQVLSAEDRLEIGAKGVEHLRTHRPPEKPNVYIYFVGEIEYKTEHASLTGAQIMARIAGWNPANSLVLESEGPAPDEVIHPTTVVEFKGRPTPAHFIIVPPATFG